MKYPFIILIAAMLFLFYKAYNTALKKEASFQTGKLDILKQDGSKIKLDIQIADTINSRAQGLMGVKKLGKNNGMLFVYEAAEMRKMWMHDTHIPLDMLFIDENKKIFGSHENAVPLSEEIIYSINPALYVLEINGGFIKKNNITPGDKIEFSTNN